MTTETLNNGNILIQQRMDYKQANETKNSNNNNWNHLNHENEFNKTCRWQIQ